MVRADVKCKTAKKKINEPNQTNTGKKSKKYERENVLPRVTRSKAVKLKKTQETGISLVDVSSRNTRLKCKENISTLPNLSPRKTRAKSEKIPLAIPLSDISSANTRLKCKENILLLPNLSPRKTRSKSEKIPAISFDSNSNQQPPIIPVDKKKTQNKLSTIRFVKLNDFTVNSIVLAKQKYSIPWPARVLQIEKERVFVFFFGDKRSGYVSKGEIYDFILSSNALKSAIASKKKPRTFCTGVAEVELLLGIQYKKSVLNII